MEYPVHITFTPNLTWRATFPDFPELVVDGPNPQVTLNKASRYLIQTLTSLLRCKGPIQGPSESRLGQQMILIPDDLALQIKMRNQVGIAKTPDSANSFTGGNRPERT